eukprot:XP_011611114.1 PREDICTED: uncharacterized protein LOC105417679 [Takifugu rubripes]
MQLHACLLLFIITTDKILSLSQHRCGGNISLDQGPAGTINLTLPGRLNDANVTNNTGSQTDEPVPVSVCTWIIDVPLGWTVHLALSESERGSTVWVRCVWNQKDHILETKGKVALSHCDGNKGTLLWGAAGQSPNSIRLSYYVQEDEWNSTEERTSARPDLDPRAQTGTILTSLSPIGPEVVTGTDGGRGRLHEGKEKRASWPQAGSSSTSPLQGPLHPTSHPQRRTAAGETDREALLLPEETTNNRAETSGAAHLTDGPVSASQRTHPYFQNTFSSGPFHTSQSTNTESYKFPGTHKPLNPSPSSSSSTRVGPGVPRITAGRTAISTSSRDYPSASSSVIPSLTSSLPDLPSGITWKGETTLNRRDVSLTPGQKQPNSWRSQRSTDGHNADLTSATTSEPLKTPTAQQAGDPGSGPTASTLAPAVQNLGVIYSSPSHPTDLPAAVEAMSFHPNASDNDSVPSATSNDATRTSVSDSSDKSEGVQVFHPVTSPSPIWTSTLQSAELATRSLLSYLTSPFTHTRKDSTPTTLRNSVSVSLVSDWIIPASSTPKTAVTFEDVAQNAAATGASTSSRGPTFTLLHHQLPTVAATPVPHLSSTHSSAPPHTPQTHTGPHSTHMATTPESSRHSVRLDHETTPVTPSTVKSTASHTPHTLRGTSAGANALATDNKSHKFSTATHLSTATTPVSEHKHGEDKEEESWPQPPSSTPAGPSQKPGTTQHAHAGRHTATSSDGPTSTASQTPKFFIVPDQPPAIKVESIELLLQIIVDESCSVSGLEDDAAAWLEPYLQRAPGFSRLQGVWSSGHAVQSLVEFKTSKALQWLSMTGPTSLLERTGLAHAVHQGRSLRSAKITNVTLGGLQADVCEWLLQCQAGYNCRSQPGTSNYSCSSVCHSDYCHHHGICTHHPGQLPVCRCLVGNDFWYMGQRCDLRMTRARLVGACVAILLVIVTVIGILAFVAVRRYKAILIQAKVDQTRSSYRRFNHFDELSGRFWLRSWAGSADSLDNPAFTRSDELLHLRALDRPCCYHDDTLSLASTCPSHGTRINTIYPHSSQYGWRGSELSIRDGVLDSGKASDLSVCSWPVEPIHWTPFPLLQQLASNRTPTVRVSRPRSYCEGMELVDLGKSWTA